MIECTYFHLLVGASILAFILIFLWRRQERSLWYLFFFAAFGLYLLFALSGVIFPIAPLSPEHAENFKPSLNLIPFYFGRCDIPELCVGGVIDNILLTIPFGFGISFITRLRAKDFLWLAPLVGLVFEMIQLILSFVFRSRFRATDINDVIFNALGIWLGYVVFRFFGWLYLTITQRFEIRNMYLFAYIDDVVQRS